MHALRRLLPRLALLASLLPATLAAAEPRLPEMGDSADQVISPQEDARLGQAFMRQLRRSAEIMEDAELDHYIRDLGRQLVAASDAPGRPFHFFIVRDKSINAFAGPGGYIGVHSGLILRTANESELAAVMAHEIAHVTQRHLARAYDTARRMQLPTAAAILAAILIGTQSGEAGQAALMSIQAGMLQKQINFTRANEKEADRIGIQTLARAGFDPRGMPAFFERLQQQMRYYGSQAPGFLQTHPVTPDRIAESRSLARRLHWRDRGHHDMYYLMQARLRVLTTDDPQVVLTWFRKGRHEHLAASASHYGEALALARLGQLDQARRLLRKLTRQLPDRITPELALARVLHRMGKDDTALRRLQRLQRLYPESWLIARTRVRILLDDHRYRAASRVLGPFAHAEHPVPELQLFLAHALEGQGAQAEAHLALAQYHIDRGEPTAAIAQLELARKQPHLSDYLAARIEARLAELRHRAALVDNHATGE